MLTRKDFKAVAEIIKQIKPVFKTGRELAMADSWELGEIEACNNITRKLADYFATQNPCFDRDRFMQACGLDKICSVCNKEHQVK